MRITPWRSRYRQMHADPLSGAVPKGVPNEDPRAARYFARAGRINAIAAEMATNRSSTRSERDACGKSSNVSRRRRATKLTGRIRDRSICAKGRPAECL